ncbi:MAG: hypothetical protein O3B96_01535, partial [bacterium]|nr:hypothetical protein [bacterium]
SVLNDSMESRDNSRNIEREMEIIQSAFSDLETNAKLTDRLARHTGGDIQERIRLKDPSAVEAIGIIQKELHARKAHLLENEAPSDVNELSRIATEMELLQLFAAYVQSDVQLPEFNRKYTVIRDVTKDDERLDGPFLKKPPTIDHETPDASVEGETEVAFLNIPPDEGRFLDAGSEMPNEFQEAEVHALNHLLHALIESTPYFHAVAAQPGTVDPRWFRNEPYHGTTIKNDAAKDSNGRPGQPYVHAFICDDVRNATYIVHPDEVMDAIRSLALFARMTKRQLRGCSDATTLRICYPGSELEWQTLVKSAIEMPSKNREKIAKLDLTSIRGVLNHLKWIYGINVLESALFDRAVGLSEYEGGEKGDTITYFGKHKDGTTQAPRFNKDFSERLIETVVTYFKPRDSAWMTIGKMRKRLAAEGISVDYITVRGAVYDLVSEGGFEVRKFFATGTVQPEELENNPLKLTKNYDEPLYQEVKVILEQGIPPKDALSRQGITDKIHELLETKGRQKIIEPHRSLPHVISFLQEKHGWKEDEMGATYRSTGPTGMIQFYKKEIVDIVIEKILNEAAPKGWKTLTGLFDSIPGRQPNEEQVNTLPRLEKGLYVSSNGKYQSDETGLYLNYYYSPSAQQQLLEQFR